MKESSKDFLEHLKNLGPMPSEDQRQKEVAQNYADMAPVLKDLADQGLVYDSMHRLRHSGIVYRAAISILLDWLPRIHNYDVKSEIVRALSVPWAKPDAAPAMIREFLAAEPSQDSYKWIVGNGLSVVADDSVANDVIQLVSDPRHGKARQMLAIALGDMRDPRVLRVLVGLLDDSQIRGHAIIGLRKLGATAAKPYLERFLKDPETWIRNEAKKAITKIERAALKRTNRPISRKIH